MENGNWKMTNGKSRFSPRPLRFSVSLWFIFIFIFMKRV